MGGADGALDGPAEVQPKAHGHVVPCRDAPHIRVTRVRVKPLGGRERDSVGLVAGGGGASAARARAAAGRRPPCARKRPPVSKSVVKCRVKGKSHVGRIRGERSLAGRELEATGEARATSCRHSTGLRELEATREQAVRPPERRQPTEPKDGSKQSCNRDENKHAEGLNLVTEVASVVKLSGQTQWSNAVVKRSHGGRI